jgi:hypothetical protein
VVFHLRRDPPEIETFLFALISCNIPYFMRHVGSLDVRCVRTCVCNPAALKAAEDVHARSKGYSTSVVMSRSTKFRTYVSRDCDHSSSR